MNVKNELQYLAQELFVPNVDETSQKFLQQILIKVNEISDGQWIQLTQATRNWINTAIECVKEGKAIPLIPIIEPITRSTASLHLLLNEDSIVPNEIKQENNNKENLVSTDITEITEIPQIKELEAKECKPNYYYEVNINGELTKVVCIRNTDKPLIEDSRGKRYFVPVNMKVTELSDKPRDVVTDKGIKEIKEKVTKEKAPKKISVSRFVRLLLFKNPELTSEQVSEAIQKEGLTVSPATLKYELAYFYSTLEILKELGMWKPYEQTNK